MSSLCERFESLVKTLDGFESIDTLLRGADEPGRKRADYFLQNRHIVIEQKTLRSNPIGRPQKFVDKLARARGIRIYGGVSTEQIFAGQPDPEDLQRKMVLDLARIIDDDVADADKQTAHTRQLFNIPEAVGILVLLNERAEVLRPDVIHFALAHSFQKKNDHGALRYAANDGTILISEANSLVLSKFQRGFPIVNFVSPSTRQAAFVTQFSDVLIRQWAAFNSAPLVIRKV